MAINPIVDEFLDYVSARSAANQPPKFEWDEWEPHLYIEPLDDDEIARLDTLTPRALLCLATGITLWTFHRLAPFGLNPLAA